MAPNVLVVRTGTANLASVLAALRRIGAQAELTSEPDAITRAERIVLPGVGAFAAAMEELSSSGLVEPLRRRLLDGRPTLCVCLGMQLLCRGSEESPGVSGLGIIEATITRFTGEVRVPQLGWNSIKAAAECRYLADGAVYFANSYRLAAPPSGWQFATSEHGGEFIAAIEQRGVLACQFHPELSGPFGTAMLRRWFEGAPTC